ncbi:MAG TPA: hypothetical protein DCP69_04165 [Candidatus Omnitrophica bacterium]|nr:hypothetical protein [Candidatus Omnitrophota bacterium]
MNRRSFLKGVLALAGVAAGAKVAPVAEATVVKTVVPEVVTWNGLGQVVSSTFTLPSDLHMLHGAWGSGVWEHMAAERFQKQYGRAAIQEEWENYWYTGKLVPNGR